MAYTWKCVRCQSPWNGIGIYCNGCQTVDALDRQNTILSTRSSGGGGGGGGGGGLGTIIIAVILDSIFFNFTLTKIIWMVTKCGAFFLFGGPFWADPEDFGI